MRIREKNTICCRQQMQPPQICPSEGVWETTPLKKAPLPAASKASKSGEGLANKAGTSRRTPRIAPQPL